mmetsp:Transcript_1671/g.4465  ORF Transcript_1671/g.4465 Transcript_1671/m.4465 type:complete len:464 (-) Transcript_1671:86-1477(-)
MHGGVRDVFDGHSNVPLPYEDLLVVRGGDHLGPSPPPLVDKGDGVDGGQMMIVLLGDLSRRGIVRDDLVVGASDHEGIVVVGIELHHVRHPTIRVGSLDLSRLSIPQSDESIERARQEPRTVVVERDVPHGGGVTDVGAHHLLLGEGPHLALPLQSSAQNEMPRAGEQTDPIDALVVSRETSHALLGDVTPMMIHVPPLGRIRAGRRSDPRASPIIELLGPVKDRGGLDRRGFLPLHPGWEEMRHFPLHEPIELFGLGQSPRAPFFPLLASLPIPFGNVFPLGQLKRIQLDPLVHVGNLLLPMGPFLPRGWTPYAVAGLVVGSIDAFPFGRLPLFARGAVPLASSPAGVSVFDSPRAVDGLDGLGALLPRPLPPSAQAGNFGHLRPPFVRSHRPSLPLKPGPLAGEGRFVKGVVVGRLPDVSPGLGLGTAGVRKGVRAGGGRQQLRFERIVHQEGFSAGTGQG